MLITGSTPQLISDDQEVQVTRNALDGSAALLVDEFGVLSTLTAEYTSAQGGIAFITPPAGKRISVRGYVLQTDAVTGLVSLDFSTSALKIARLYTTKVNQLIGSIGHIDGAIGEVLTLTTTTSTSNVFVSVNYILI